MYIKDIKAEALKRLAINRYQAMLIYGVVYTIILNFAIITYALWVYGIVLYILLFVMMAPLSYSLSDFYIKAYKCQKVDPFRIFEGFNKYNFERIIILQLVRTGLILLSSLLLIVPGIIYACRTSMSVYLLRANPKMKPIQALKASNKIMKGFTGNFFKMAMTFTGWFLLGIVTLGLGLIWMFPYFNLSKVVYYKRVLQSDKTVYADLSVSKEETAVNEEVEEDNVATKLIKMQLSQEIESLNSKIKKVTSELPISTPLVSKETDSEINANPKQEDIVYSDKLKSSDKVKTNPLSALDNFTNDIKTNDISFDDEITSVNILISEPGISDVKEVALPVVKTVEKKPPNSISEPLTAKTIITNKEPILKVEAKPQGNLEANYVNSEPSLGNVQHGQSRDAIKQRIEQLRLEREKRTIPARPTPHSKELDSNFKEIPKTNEKQIDKKTIENNNTSKPIVKNQKYITGEFEREVIEIEVDEDK